MLNALEAGFHNDGRATPPDIVERALRQCRQRRGQILHFPAGHYVLDEALVLGDLTRPGSEVAVSVMGEGRECVLIERRGGGPVAVVRGRARGDYMEKCSLSHLSLQGDDACLDLTLSGRTSLDDLELMCAGTAIEAADEAVSVWCSNVSIYPLDEGAGRVEIGLRGRFHHLVWTGGRIYSCDTALLLGGESMNFRGVNVEFAGLVCGQLDTLGCLKFDSCHLEAFDCLYTNAMHPFDDDAEGWDVNGEICFDGCLVAGNRTTYNPLVVKGRAGLIHRMRLVGGRMPQEISSSFVGCVMDPLPAGAWVERGSGLVSAAPRSELSRG